MANTTRVVMQCDDRHLQQRLRQLREQVQKSGLGQSLLLPYSAVRLGSPNPSLKLR